MSINKLILGDCLEILKTIETDSVDLIYLDPPFFSNRNYEVIWGDEGEIRSFQDRWSGGIDHYIAWLNERVKQMYRVLKPTGSIFLHCDWHANAYIRVRILDKIFRESSFREEIIWKRQTAKKGSQFEKKTFGCSTDTIFWYSKTNNYTFKIPKTQLDDDVLLKKFNKTDENKRRFRTDNIILISAMARENLIYEYKNYTPKYGWMVNKEKLEQMDNEGRLYWSATGHPYRKYFLDEYEGQEISNIWLDIPLASGQERIGYPTQKPKKLLQRIIECTTNEGDVVLDPFMGGGTTIAVADKLNRKWIGIDQSVQAVKVTEMRLCGQTDIFTSTYADSYSLELHKYDYDTLRNKDAYEFETWIIGQYGGTAQNRKGGDKGIDGTANDGAPIQVKRSENIGVNVVKNFSVSARQYDKTLFEKNVKAHKPVGYIIAFSFGKGAIQEVARLKNEEDIIIVLVNVEDIIPMSRKPNITVTINEISRDYGAREIEFIAVAKSDAKIEFYSWDFDYDESKGFKPQVIRDVEGKQLRKLNAGTYHIAVKAVDNDGLEGIEIIKLKVNGEVERQKTNYI